MQVWADDGFGDTETEKKAQAVCGTLVDLKTLNYELIEEFYEHERNTSD
jgi:hypothetical protein